VLYFFLSPSAIAEGLKKKYCKKTKGLIAKAVTGENNPFYNKSHSLETKIRIMEAKSAYPVYVYNSFKELLFSLQLGVWLI